jgi:hypothetical protein
MVTISSCLIRLDDIAGDEMAFSTGDSRGQHRGRGYGRGSRPRNECIRIFSSQGITQDYFYQKAYGLRVKKRTRGYRSDLDLDQRVDAQHGQLSKVTNTGSSRDSALRFTGSGDDLFPLFIPSLR